MSDTSGDKDEETFPELVSRVVDDAKEVARAEIALVRAQASAKVGGLVARYRAVAILFGTAALLAVAGLIGLVVGLILTLAPHAGPGWATAIVIGATMVLAGLLGWLGSRRLRQG